MKRLFCMLIAISFVFITGCGASNDTSQDAPSPEIIRGGPVSSSDENPSAGQVSVYDKLAEQIKANKNKDALFAVKVVLCGVTDGIVEEYHKAYMDALNAPVIQEYNAQYNEWSRIPIEKLDFNAAQFRKAGSSMPDSFYAYWVSTHTAEERAAYDAAWAVAEEKHEAYINIYNVLPEVGEKKTFEEVNRLQDEGLLLVWKDYTEMVGFLTGEQITHFPVNDCYGYYIVWSEIPGNGGYFIDE